MAIPVYVQPVTTYPGRTEWDSSADYVVGDRVYYADSISDHSVYVCVQDQNLSGGGTAQQPDLTPNYWQPAGSREYPFLTGPDGNIYNSGFNVSEFCVRHTNGFTSNWDPARYLSISDGSTRAHVILMDGVFVPLGVSQPFIDLLNTDFYAENFQKSWFIYTYYQQPSTDTPETCPTFNNLKIGLHNNNVSFDSHIFLNNCLVSDSSPYSTRTSLKNIFRFQHGKFMQAKDCLFDFSMCKNNNFMQQPFVSPTYGRSFLKNTTVIFGGQDTQYSGIFYQASELIVDKCIFYVKGLVELTVPKIAGASEPYMSSSCVFGESFADTDYFVTGNSGRVDDSNFLNVDPQFVDIQNSDYRLRPSSPLIGGMGSTDKRSEIESQYPQGKWFDSNAADGGDGNWDTPYNNYGEAINSFTGDEAVVLIKEGQHPLQSGFWSGSSWTHTNDLPKAYSDGVKFIGMGEKSIFIGGNEVASFPAFYSSSYGGNDQNPNLINSPFLLKDFTILLTSSYPYNRSLWSLRKGTMINIHVRPTGPSLGNSGSNLFDYNMDNSTGDYLHMTSCSIEVTFEGTYGNFCAAAGGKQFSSCTFIDPNHQRAQVNYPKNFLHNSAGNLAGSFIKDCIFYTKSSGFNNTGASTTLCQLSNTVFYSTQDELTLSSGTNKTNCAVVDPRFINDNGYEEMDLRLRPDSPLIGGLKVEPSGVYYLEPGAQWNGDGSQKDGSQMTDNGQPGPFNSFKEVYAQGTPYGSKVIIVNGTYPWQSEFNKQPLTNVWQTYTWQGYDYEAETDGEVIFDGANGQHYLMCHTLGGTDGAGTYLDLDTSVVGVTFQNVTGAPYSASRNMISAWSDAAGKGTFLFNRCKFINWTNTSTSASYPLTGGGRNVFSPVLKFHNCLITYCTEGAGLFSGGDGFADNSFHGNWEYINNTIVVLGVGETTFNGRNSSQGTYKRPIGIFGTYPVSQHIVQGNIFYMSGTDGSQSILNSTDASRLPDFENNLFYNVDLGVHEDLISNKNILNQDPLFVDINGDNFSLRPLSPLVGQG